MQGSIMQPVQFLTGPHNMAQARPQMVNVSVSGGMVGGIPQMPDMKVGVPWGWKRLLLADTVVYFSPSGIQLKSIEEVQDYLSTEGTCKCGLECPLNIPASFDFDSKVSSEIQLPVSSIGGQTQCKQHSSTLALAQIQSNTGFAIRHYHNPTFNRTRDGVTKKVKKKKKPFSGVLVSQMLAAREAEKQRINEIIAQQKALEVQNPASQAQETPSADSQPQIPVSVQETPMEVSHPSTVIKPEPEEDQRSQNMEEIPPETPPLLLPPGTPPPHLTPGTPPPHLTPRMVHPAFSSRSMMNLGEVLSQAPDSPMRPGPDSPSPHGGADQPKKFSLAEAMQAARRQNQQQEQKEEELNLNSLKKEDMNMAVSDIDGGRLMILETEAEEANEVLSPKMVGDAHSPEKEKGWDDQAKNIEIRRLSNTDDGNKVLEATFHSPDKDAKKNPLMNIFNIVSGMEAVPSATEDDRGPPPPGQPTALGTLRPQLRGRRNRAQYSTLPPLPHSPPPWVLGGQPGGPRLPLPPPGAQQQIVLAPQMMLQGQVPPQQQVMQLIQTVNGPMLVPVAPQQQMVQLQASPAPLMTVGPRPPTSLATTSTSPPKGKARKPQGSEPAPSPGPISQPPFMMAPTGGVVSFQSAPSQVSGAQMIFTQAGPAPGAQLVVGGQGMQGMQGMILVPQPQGIMYQQMPDGTLVQVQSQMQGILPQGQILLPGPNQVVQGGPGQQVLMAPGGLVQGLQPVQPGLALRQLVPGSQPSQPKKKPAAKKKQPKKKAKLVTEGADQDETDTSYEEPQPSTSCSLSPRSSIQSNKVDSSGLNATPPHQKDTGDYEQLRQAKSPESEMEFRDLLDTSVEGDEREEDRAETSTSNISFIEEKIVISDEEEESGLEEEMAHHSKSVSSSSKKKKKRKKKTSYKERSRSRGSSRGKTQLLHDPYPNTSPHRKVE